jgi:hypothetical protein
MNTKSPQIGLTPMVKSRLLLRFSCIWHVRKVCLNKILKGVSGNQPLKSNWKGKFANQI